MGLMLDFEDEKLELLFEYFNQFDATEEFYVGDIKETIIRADDGELELLN